MNIAKTFAAMSVLAGVASGSNIRTQGCFELGDGVVLGFDVDFTQAGDWIGLFRPNQINNDVAPDPLGRNWVNTCGAQDCFTTPATGLVMIANPNVVAGEWVAAVMRWDGFSAAPYPVVALSPVFTISAVCAAPTRAPTPAPILGPTPFPTLGNVVQPTPVPAPVVEVDFGNIPFPQDEVHTNKLVYTFGEPFAVNLDLPSKREGDWVAIFDANVDLNNLQGDGHLWLWVNCNRQGSLAGCPATNTPSTVIFGGEGDPRWASEWPLPIGNYIAVALRDEDGPPWVVADSSRAFSIVRPTRLDEFAMLQLRQDVEALIEEDIGLASKFMRLGFHDCTGGCDGCVDMDFDDNLGLVLPIDVLQPIADRYEDMFSRADVWAFATMVGAEVSQPDGFSDFRVGFDLFTFGRLDCEFANTVCRNAAGFQVPCDSKHGPHREIPGMNLGTHEVFEFFEEEYNMDMRESVTLMGAHTLGVLARNNSGVDGENGWVEGKRVLDNEYYVELVGFSASDDLRSLIQFAPNWERSVEDNSDQPEFPDRHIWTALPPNLNGSTIVMLNTDIGLVRTLDDTNKDTVTGEVFCKFLDRNEVGAEDPVCPHVEGAIQMASAFRNNNTLWLLEFEEVMEKMVNNKYTVSNRCVGPNLCELDPIV